MNETIVNINGTLLPKDQAKIPVFDRGFLYGDSVYEVTQTYEKKPVYLQEHFDRLWLSAKRIAMKMPFTPDGLKEEIKKTLAAVNYDRAYIRIVVTRGEGEIGLDPTLPPKSNFVIIIKEQLDNPSWWYDKGLKLIIADILRNDKASLDPDIKSGNYLNNVLAMAEAKKRGAFDAIMINKEGMITEGTTYNIWIVKNNVVITPPLASGILKGITREKLLEVMKDNRVQFLEKNVTPDELREADEVFITSSTKDIVPVCYIDDKPIADGEVGPYSKDLLKLYREKVFSDLKKYSF